MTTTHKLALIGFGVVGQALAEVIAAKQAQFEALYNLNLQIVAVSAMTGGPEFRPIGLYHPHGLNPAQLLETIRATGTFDAYPEAAGLERNWDSLQTIRHSNADTIVEVSFTNLTTGQPAIDHCRAAFAGGKNMVMSNKGPVALAYRELNSLARENGVKWFFESSVMSGTPCLRMSQSALSGCTISAIRGILNGTTNYILTQMEAGNSYEVALKEAQALGYAEADPTADVEGYDALGKVLIMANVVMNTPLTKAQTTCQGISRLTQADIERARAEGKRWKLIGWAKKEGDVVTAGVQPEMLPLTDPLAGVMGVTNAITFQTDLLGAVTLIGPGAGGKETVAGLLADIITIAGLPSSEN